MTLFNNLFSKAPEDLNALDQPEDVLQEDPRKLVPEGTQLVMNFIEDEAEDAPAVKDTAFGVPPQDLLTLTPEEKSEMREDRPEEKTAEQLPDASAAQKSLPDDDFLAELRALLNGTPGVDEDVPSAEPDAEAAAQSPEVPADLPVQAEEPAAAEETETVDVPEAVVVEAVEASEAAEEPASEEPAAPAAAEESAPAPSAEEKAEDASAEPGPTENAGQEQPWPPKDPTQSEEERRKVLEKDTLTRVSYASVAEAALGKQTDPTKKTRAPIDDETLLAELYALMGDTPKKPAQQVGASAKQQTAAAQTTDRQTASEPDETKATARRRAMVDVERPESQTELEVEEDIGGAPGWLKGAFLLLLSLLLSGMTFYAIATDLFGKLF